MTEIPEIYDTGTEGTQEASSGKALAPLTKNPFQPIQEAANGLAASNPSSLGGVVGARMMAASVTHISNDLHDTKQELKDARDKLEIARNELSNATRDVAVLTEKIKSISGVRHLKNVSISAGTILFGFAIDFSRNQFDATSVVLAVIGILLIIMGWHSPKGDKNAR